jgi:hypothetical protein
MDFFLKRSKGKDRARGYYLFITNLGNFKLILILYSG